MPIAAGSGTVAVEIKPRMSIQNDTPNVAQDKSMRLLEKTIAEAGSGGSGRSELARAPSHCAVRRHASRPMSATAVTTAPLKSTGEAACGVPAATSTTPVPRITACMANADTAAALRRTPARSASRTNPATLQTFPGR